MTLEKVIKDFEENAEECNRVADTQKFDEGDSINNWYRKKADYSQQVAQWLKELKKLRQKDAQIKDAISECKMQKLSQDEISSFEYEILKIYEVME